MISVKVAIVATDLGKMRVRAHDEASGSLSELVNNILGVMHKPVSGIALAPVTPNKFCSSTKGRNTIYD